MRRGVELVVASVSHDASTKFAEACFTNRKPISGGKEGFEEAK